jgi:CDP-diacylglycerol---serine O-phosphatidyltransferase
MLIKRHIPNFITLLNLFSGCIGIVFLFKGNVHLAAGMIWIAALFDFCDGFAARLLKVQSKIGKELDSLSDIVSFGLLPSVVIFHLFESMQANVFFQYSAFLVTLFSALRLAKFNVDTRQYDSFIGLPVPANAIMISSFPFILSQYGFFMFAHPGWLLGITLLLSYLLVSELPLFSLKLRGFGWKENRFKYSFLITSVILLMVLHVVAIPIVVFLYIIFSLLMNYLPKQNRL